MNKKAFLFDFGYFVIILFAVAIGIAVAYYATSTINTQMLSGTTLTGTSRQIVQGYEDNHATWINWFYGLLFFGVFLAICIIAYTVKSHPVLAGFMLLILIVIAGLSIHFANVYYDFSHGPGVSDKLQNLNIIQNIMDNYPYLVVGLGIVFLIILFTARGDNNQIPI